MIKNCEILAPVGNREMLDAAIKSGADAVYLGTEEFNARRNAQNFKKEELKEIIKLCHQAGVKVYLTLNILIADTEFFNAVSLCFYAYNSGVDGVIIADLGLAYYLHKNLPELPLHASTQMTVFSPSALPVLKEMGFTRVVAARELNKEQLTTLCNTAKELNMEVEVFVHGALCMCVSGQCLFSAFLGSRSGNRGLCAGPCRLPFTANEKGEYALSLKDLSLLDYLGELKEMGVCSFKIEGRMKRPEYVAAAITASRQILENGFAEEKLNGALKSVFSRQGFTNGYYKNKVDKNMFGVRSKDDVIATNDALPYIHSLYRKQPQKTAVTAKLSVFSNKPSELTFSENGNTVTVFGEQGEVAQNKPLDYGFVQKCIQKLGNTPFYLEKFEFYCESGLTLASASLNELRRNAVLALYHKRAVLPKQITPVLPQSKTPANKTPKGFVLRLPNISFLPNDLGGVKAVVLPIESINKNCILGNTLIVAELFRVYENEETIKSELNRIKELGIKYVLCGNIAHLTLVKKAGLVAFAGFGMNCFSSFFEDFAKANGIKGLLLSPEMSFAQIKSSAFSLPTAVIGYGKIPLMVFKNCPVKSFVGCDKCKKQGVLTDRKNTKFNLVCKNGFCELLNSTPIYLADKQDGIFADWLMLYFTNETKEEIIDILEKYKNGEPLNTAFTRGLYQKGVF